LKQYLDISEMEEIEVRLLGYYNGPEQKMSAEVEEPERAAELAVQMAAAYPAPTPAPIPTPIAKPIATSPTTFKTVETVKTIQVTPTPARPKIDIAEDEYLGKIKVLSHRVQIVEPQPPCDAKYLLIDNKMGFRLGCSIREVDYQEDEWVVCKLKPKAKDNGEVFHYVVDIHPAE
jgi:hypothetical protein